MNEKFRFSAIISDGLIVAARKPFLVRAYGEGIATFTLKSEYYEEVRTAKSENGVFETTFNAQAAGNINYTLTGKCGGETLTVRDVYFGEVYLAIGQSNMSYELSATELCDEVAERASRRGIRVFDIYDREWGSLENYRRPYLPQSDFLFDNYKWKSGGELMGVSAIGVMTAVEISEKKHIPVGVITATMGGLGIEAYLPRESLNAYPDEIEFLKSVGKYDEEKDYNNRGIRNFTQLSGIYNEKISPLIGFGITGVIWYLGESSANNYESGVHFGKELEILVNEYRKIFGDVPFAFIQIAPENYFYGDGNGYMYVNEAIEDAARALEDCYVVPIYDIEPRWLKEDGQSFYHPIHPVNKLPVAERTAKVFIEGREQCPHISDVKFVGGKALCNVKSYYGLRRGKRFSGFTLAGEDGKYYPADSAVTKRFVIEVSSKYIKEPKKLTYAFCNYQESCNAVDQAKNPLLPYRTERGSADGKYWTHPAYLTCKAKYTTENCFGCTVGISRKVPTWVSGKIYDAHVKISYEKDLPILKIKANPDNGHYFFFGASPNICLSGRRHHLDGFGYMELDVSATDECEFFGLVVRTANGECKRFAPFAGDNTCDSVAVGKGGFKRYCVCLGEWLLQDSNKQTASEEERKKIAEAQLLFRGTKPVTVRVKNIGLCDERIKMNVEEQCIADEREFRADTVVMQR